jgi:lipoprotein NlpI
VGVFGKENAQGVAPTTVTSASMGAAAPLADIDSALTLSPEVGRLHLERATILQRQGRCGEAIDAYTHALNLNAPKDMVLRGRELCDFDLHDLDAARKDNAALLLLHPRESRALVIRVAIDAALSDMTALTRDLDVGIEVMPDEARLRTMRASLRLERENYAGALADARAAEAVAPSDGEALDIRARAADRLGMDAEADAAFRRLVELKPDNPEHRLHAGHNLAARLEFRAALEQFDAGLRLAPDGPELLAARAAVEAKMGDQNAAIRDWRMAQQVLHSPSAYAQELGESLLEHARFGDALEVFNDALAAQPGNASFLRMRGLARMLSQDFARASEDLRNSYAAEPMPQVMMRIGQAALFDARYDEAVAAFAGLRQASAHDTGLLMWSYLAHAHVDPEAARRELLAADIGETTDWYAQIIDFFLERTDASTLESVAADAAGTSRLERMCEAAYAIGQDDLLRGVDVEAREQFERVVRNCSHDLDSIGATAELRRFAVVEPRSLLGPRVAATRPAAPPLGVDSVSKDDDESDEIALARLTAAVLHDPRDGVSLRKRSALLVDMGQYDRALADADAAVALEPDGSGAAAQRAVVLMNKGELPAAIAGFDRAIALDENNDYAWALRGWTHHLAGNDEAALSDQKHAIGLKPDFAQAMRGRANVLYHLLEFEGALDSAEAAQNLEEMPAYQEFIGHIQYQLRRYADAAESLDIALTRKPGNSYGALWLHLARLRSGDATAAPGLAQWTDAHDQKDWPRPIIDFMLGRADRTTIDTAIAAADKPDTRRDRRCEADYFVGEWLMVAGRSVPAKPLFERAAADCPHYFIEWAGARAELESWPEAISASP